MACAIALARRNGHRAIDALRMAVVAGCALALIAADAALPGLSL
ncbi:hypothetical protein [Pelagerythrobacter rhizovicinus]|nr:hypothetical protein [Pelagerythrobacter rhizovicinus]